MSSSASEASVTSLPYEMKTTTPTKIIPEEHSTSTSTSNGHPKSTPSSSSSPSAAAVKEPIELQKAGHLLKALYEIHDFFFTADKAEKKEMLKEASAKVLRNLETFGEGSNNHDRARVAFLRGRTLDVFEEYNKEAEVALAKAVKLEPSSIEAWNALGHCFWKKRDLGAAKGCFQQALAKRVNKTSLRQLSMLLRQLPTKTAADAQKNIQESLQRAKDAVKLDLSDPTSWYIMGNAYVTIFFKLSHAHDDLERAMQAYQRAESNGGHTNPDLFFNKANVLRYKEDFALAAEAFRKASDLDPSLPGEEALQAIKFRVRRTVEMLSKKGRMKEKRLSQLVAALDEAAAIDITEELKEKKGLELVMLDQLKEGANKGKMVALKLVLPVGQLDHPPNAFIMADRTGKCTIMSLYHLDQEGSRRFGEKDVFHILNPCIKHVVGLWPSSSSSSVPTTSSFNAENEVSPSSGAGEEEDEKAIPPSSSSLSSLSITEEGTYDTIQILDPSSFLINGSTVDARYVTPAVVKLDNFDL